MQQSNESLETSNQTTNNSQANSQPAYTPNPLSRDARRAARESTRGEGIKADTQRSQQRDTGGDNKGSPEDDNGEPRRIDLGELFREEDTGDGDDGPIDHIDKVQKRLGLKPEEFYKVKVPMPNGAEPLTFGEMKDRVAELVDLETRETQFTQRRIASEGKILQDQREVREILSMLPAETVQKLPVLVEKVRKKHEATLVRENALTLEHIPEWNDEATSAKDKAEMTKFLGNWGFDETFLNSIVDHRAMKFVRDMMIVDKKIKTALSKVKIPDRKGMKPSAKTGKPAAKPAREQSSQRQSMKTADQQSRIMAFLNRSE